MLLLSASHRMAQETALLKAELRGLLDDKGPHSRPPVEEPTLRQDSHRATESGTHEEGGAGEPSLAEYLTSTGRVREGSPEPGDRSTAREPDMSELPEVESILHLLKTEREIADWGQSKVSSSGLRDTRQHVEAQREALSHMQRELQGQRIELEAKMRDVSEREKQQYQRDAHAKALLASVREQVRSPHFTPHTPHPTPHTPHPILHPTCGFALSSLNPTPDILSPSPQSTPPSPVLYTKQPTPYTLTLHPTPYNPHPTP
jgi:hypothetical protein